MLKRPLATLATLAALSLLAACGSDSDSTATDTDTGGTGVSCAYNEDGSGDGSVDAPPSEAAVSGDVAATMKTSVGDLGLTLTADATPCTVNSFVSLAEQGYFDGTTCHRMTTEGIFVLQCGDPTATGSGGPGYAFDDELTGQEKYPAGTLAMANAGPNTNGSQFFVVYDETDLPPSYTVFGTVDAAGVKIVQGVAADGTTPPSDGAPNTPVDIDSVTVD